MHSATASLCVSVFLRFWVGLLLCAPISHVLAQTDLPMRLGSPYVLASNESELQIEIPIQLPEPWSTRSYIRLASPSAHAQKGIRYPDWLSGASYSIKSRLQQRTTLIIQPIRGNPDLATELVLEWGQDGRRQFIPYTLLLDRISPFVGATLQPTPDDLPASSAAAAPSPVGSASPIVSAKDASPVAVPPLIQNKSKSTKRPAKASSASKRTSTAKSAAPQPDTAPAQAAKAPDPVASQALAPAQLTSAPAQLASAPTPPVAVTAPQRAIAPAIPQSFAYNFAYGLELWDWILAIAGMLLLIFLITKLWLMRKARLAEKAPLLTQETQFQRDAAQEGSTNTVFGLPSEDANQMHLEWMSQKNIKT